MLSSYRSTQSISTDHRQPASPSHFDIHMWVLNTATAHDRLSASRTNHTSAPLEHHCAQVCNNTRHHPNKHDQLCTSTVTPLCASYLLPCTIVHPSHRLHCLRARSNPGLLGFHQLHNHSHPQPARWDRWPHTSWTWSTRSQIAWCAFRAPHSSRSTAAASRSCGCWAR